MVSFYDLTEPLCHRAQKFADAIPPELTYVETIPQTGANNQKINTVLHFGTHIDAPFHAGFSMDVSEIPLDRVYGTGVVVDIPKNDWELITEDELEKAKPQIQEDDIVIIRTGWHQYWGKDEIRYAYKYPGLSKEGAEWLVSKKIKLLGIDTITPEPIFSLNDGIIKSRPDIFSNKKIDREKYPLMHVHKTLLGNNIFMLEQVGGQINEVSGQRLTIAAFPIKLVNGDGCQVRVVAIKR